MNRVHFNRCLSVLVAAILLASCSAIKEAKINPPNEEESTLPQETGLTFTIQNAASEDLGFLLMIGSNSGECIFLPSPTAGNFETPEFEHISSLRDHGEFSWIKKPNQTEIFTQEGEIVAWIRGTELHTDRFNYMIFDVAKIKPIDENTPDVF